MNRNSPSNHIHTPSCFSSPFLRFWDFFFRRKKLCFTYDNTGKCSVCQADIAVPRAYSHWLLNVIFCFAGILLAVLWAVLFPSTMFTGIACYLYLVIGLFLLDRIIRSAVLAFFPWRTYMADEINVEAQWKNAKRELLMQQYCLTLSALFTAIIAILLAKG